MSTWNLRRAAGSFPMARIAGPAVALGLLAAVPAAEAQLALDRMFLLPTHIEEGPGTVRLDGMGGFETAVEDENLEISLWDFARNPSGFPDDRDAWNVEVRYGHQEYAERDPDTDGDDLRINEGSFSGGFYRPGRVGAGIQAEYTELSADDYGMGHDEYRLVGLRGTVGTYLTGKLAVGANIGFGTEEQTPFSPAIYKIGHDSTQLRGGLGASYRILEGLAVGGLGEIISSKLDGTSEGDYHTDAFDWTRPANRIAAHAIIDRGRLQGAVGYTREDMEGEESVRISWSKRFVYNPTLDFITGSFDTFTEERLDSALRTRWRVDLVPRRIAVSLATVNADREFTVVTNPNAIGSLATEDVDAAASSVIAGVSFLMLQERLLLAGEVKRGSVDVTTGLEGGDAVDELTETLGRVGGEYFLGETVVGRLGLTHGREEYDLAGDSPLDGTYNTSRLAVGLGLIPSGGIWQFDLALDLNLQSDLDSRRTNLAAYVRHLF